MASEEWVPCVVCGVRREPGALSDAQWLWVEIQRLDAPGWWEAIFCSEEHVAQWIGPPMPPSNIPEPRQTILRRLLNRLDARL